MDFKICPNVDQIIVMSVVPGKSGQKYIESSHEKTKHTIEKLHSHGFGGIVEIDGGVNLENVGECFVDGARSFVGGGAMVGQSDIRLAIRNFRQALLEARRSSLIKKANELGGAKLTEKWINLHLGEKHEKLLKLWESSV